MYIIEVSENKVNDLANTISKMLHYGGMAMECIEDMRSGARYDNEDMHAEERHYAHGARYGGEDFPYGHGARYGMRDNDWNAMRDGTRYDAMRDDAMRDDEWDEDYRLNERRGRSAITGRYVRRY